MQVFTGIVDPPAPRRARPWRDRASRYRVWSARGGESSGVLTILTPRRGRPAGRGRRQATVGVQVSALITLTSHARRADRRLASSIDRTSIALRWHRRGQSRTTRVQRAESYTVHLMLILPHASAWGLLLCAGTGAHSHGRARPSKAPRFSDHPRAPPALSHHSTCHSPAPPAWLPQRP